MASATHHASWRSLLATALLLSLSLLLAACGGSDEGTAVALQAPIVASITVSPADDTVSVGLTRAVTAEAKDQNGAVMSGVAFTWASSDNAIASVSDGVATAVAAGTATITASSGGVTSNAARLTVTAVVQGSVGIDKPVVFLAASGQSRQLVASVRDAQGAVVPGAVRWTSTAPAAVSVDADGVVVARAIGSAQIFAEAGGVRSAPTLAIVAAPVPDALLVSDAQVVSVGPPLGLAAGAVPGVGTQYEVALQDIAAPVPGTVLLAAETAPVAGKVVAVRAVAAGWVATIEIVPLYRLFSAYDIELTVPLAAFAIEDVPERATALGGGAIWSRERSHALAAQRQARPLGLEPFKAWKCDASIKPQLAAAPIALSFENKLELILIDRPGYTKHALAGSMEIVGSAGLTLKAGFKASGRCDAQGQIKLPVLGWFSALVMPAVRVGIGAELEGEILLVQGELGVEGRIGVSPLLGWECGGAVPTCRGLDDFPLVDKLKTKSKIPSANDMQAKVSAHVYLLAGLDAAILLGALNAEIVEARVGPKQSFDVAFEEDQAARPDYASTYDLKLEGMIEPGAHLQKAIEAVIGDDSTTVKFKAEFARDLSESPKGSLGLSAAKVRPDEPVDFTVTLAPPSTLEYWQLGYNVTGAELYRRRAGELEFTRWKAMNQIASNTFTYRWTPAEADAGTYELAAFVNTQIGVPWLEVAPNSVQTLEVSCFAAKLDAPTDRARVQTAARGARARPLATACTDTWAGTATYIAKTPGLPTANIASHSSVTWTVDPAQSTAQNIIYKASGTFDLAFNHPDACTTTLSPNTFTIVEDLAAPARLILSDYGVIPPTYAISGAQRVDTTATVRCPGRSDTVTELKGFLVLYASGSGSYTKGQTILEGSTEDAATTASWSFSRP